MRSIRTYMTGPLWLEPSRAMAAAVPDRVWEVIVGWPGRIGRSERDAQFWTLTRETILLARRDL